MINEINDIMLSCSFNQNQSLCSIGLDTGYRIYSFKKVENNEINNLNKSINTEINYIQTKLEGGVSLVELYFETNIIFLVGGGSSPMFSKNKLIIWDDSQQQITNELVFNGFINSVKVKKDLLFVVLEKKFHVIDFLSLKSLEVIDNSDASEFNKINISINLCNSLNLVAFYDKLQGNLKIKNLDSKNIITFKAHQSNVTNFQFNYEGDMIATTSENANVARVFRSFDAFLLGEFCYNESKNIPICFINFERNNKYFLTSSINGIITIFNLENSMILYKSTIIDKNFLMNETKYSSFKYNEIIINNIDEKNKNNNKHQKENAFSEFFTKKKLNICIFTKNNNISIINSEGTYYEACIMPGICKKSLELNLNLNEYK